jgi:hypothetical protein
VIIILITRIANVASVAKEIAETLDRVVIEVKKETAETRDLVVIEVAMVKKVAEVQPVLLVLKVK